MVRSIVFHSLDGLTKTEGAPSHWWFDPPKEIRRPLQSKPPVFADESDDWTCCTVKERRYDILSIEDDTAHYVEC